MREKRFCSNVFFMLTTNGNIKAIKKSAQKKEELLKTFLKVFAVSTDLKLCEKRLFAWLFRTRKEPLSPIVVVLVVVHALNSGLRLEEIVRNFDFKVQTLRFQSSINAG